MSSAWRNSHPSGKMAPTGSLSSFGGFKLGFEAGQSNPCVLYHAKREIAVLVHGDDYFSTGRMGDLEWLKGELEKKFSLKSTIVGWRDGDEKELRILNRIVRCEEDGVAYEPDLRHAEIIVKELVRCHHNSVVTPGSD